jgi:hypothetical protein
MSLRRFALALAVLSVPASFHDANAKKNKDKSEESSEDSKEIQNTGVKEFDEVFAEVKSIRADLSSIESSIRS